MIKTTKSLCRNDYNIKRSPERKKLQRNFTVSKRITRLAMLIIHWCACPRDATKLLEQFKNDKPEIFHFLTLREHK